MKPWAPVTSAVSSSSSASSPRLRHARQASEAVGCPACAEPADLPTPAVAPEEYDRDYYLDCCAGAEEWRESGGRAPLALYEGVLTKAGLRQGETVVDIGTGRGELVAVAIELGAARATGVDYSERPSSSRARRCAVHDLDDRARSCSPTRAPYRCQTARPTWRLLLDVVEHLSPPELDDARGRPAASFARAAACSCTRCPTG